MSGIDQNEQSPYEWFGIGRGEKSSCIATWRLILEERR